MIELVWNRCLQIVERQEGEPALSRALSLGKTLHLVANAGVRSEAGIGKKLSYTIGIVGRQTDRLYVRGEGHGLSKLQHANVVGHRLIMIVWMYNDLVDLQYLGLWIAALLRIAVSLHISIRWIPIAQ